ncbi:BAH and coiled-coil domain-containing protein 1 [Nephila pilipes]|uniref:BAH and coiled-coil domain-containing protein 1 n=1 Tax=Nephila pilipes TaxID=299642 RepID=A0A8X6Q3F6_NEPPI|nr:BAH and coiled-coil domain-containing protein 1 [Nephila pilipes]
MNGRVFAVNRSPVLAWNIEPQLQVPYPDMPAAAAAAISPIVPAASDPYGRCWQNQVDAGTSFPYFGTLYNNSLPPTAYRLQPGCMPNLGQFWPPTPPPDGCGRFDGSNLYFGPPVLRHTDNISSNMRNSYPGIAHYSHLVETSKEQSQRLFKRETPISPTVSAPSISICSSGSKSDNNLNSCCVVDSKMKSQISIAHSLPKPELHTVSSGHEPYLCAPDIRSSSNIHPSTDKSCFSPSHSLKNNLNFHNTSQDSIHRTKSVPGNQDTCNASPLKNVYFSHYESENINSAHSKNSEKHIERQFQLEHKNNMFVNGNKSKHLYQSSNGYNLANFSPKKHDYQGVQEFHNGTSSSNIIRADKESVMLIKEHYKQKSATYKVKPEKSVHSDCKFQKNNSKNSVVIQGPEYKNSDVFNIPTSVLHPKIEPSDKYFLSSCSSTAPSCMASSYATSGPFLMAKDLSSDLRPSISYQNSIYQNSSSLGKTWHYNELPAISLDNYFQSPEAAKPPSQNPPYVSSALHEGLISVAQTAPQDIEVMKVAGMLQDNVQPVSLSVKCKESDADDEVQIIGVQTKNSSGKNETRHSDRKSYVHLPVSEPLCLKQNKKEKDVDFQKIESVFEDCSSSKSPFSHKCETIILDDEEHKPILNAENLKQVTENSCPDKEDSNLKVDCKIDSPCKNITIKQESVEEHELTSDECAKEKTDKIVPKSEPQSDKDLNCDLKTDISKNNDKVVIKLEEETVQGQEMVYNENHGLNLLWNTIEKVTSFERTDDSNYTSAEISAKVNQMNEPVDTYDSFKEINNVRGLDLLSVIAVQRLVSEFDVCKSEAEESSLKCNYPEIKEIKVLLEDDQTKHICEVSKNSSQSFVFEIQTRLVELRKKYKQKQKELLRLKPKRRFINNSYLKGRQKSLKDISDRSSSNISCTESDNLNSSFSSVDNDEAEEKSEDVNQISSNIKSKPEGKFNVIDIKTKRRSRISSIKREPLNEMSTTLSNRRITRRNVGKQTLSDTILEISEESKCLKKNTRGKSYKLKKASDSILNSSSDTSQTLSSKSTINRNSSKKSCSLPENVKTTKVYSLRHTSQNVTKKSETAEITVLVSKTISSKRKSVNPKKYIPSKQSKLSETIIAKQLRSRILFDTSGSTSDDENLKDEVPDDLYVALMKCHLGEETKCGNKKPAFARGLGYPEPKRLSSEHLVERQRLLALEDGLFYAGFIKEYQSPKKYGIALDGQRGNRLHMFTREELLTQAIVESKPLTSELPEGTRVCAYWSQQYRCLYPGVVGKAPCPSADWSEPRVFVLFDDGDSGQIPAKNVRLIPEDIIPIENISRTDPINALISCYSKQRTNSRGRSRKLKCSTPKSSNMKHSDTSNENESKESSCGSINESSCDDSCFIDYSLSPSHTPEDHNSMSCSLNSTSSIKLGKRQRKHSKRRTSRRIKLEQVDPSEIKDKCEAKTKRHKKYKDKHRKHHHHHHRHHHHHHHHHHSKKRKHRRKIAKNTTPQDLENCIPCNSNLKSYKDTQSRAKACTDLIEHSSTVNLPQSEQNRVC